MWNKIDLLNEAQRRRIVAGPQAAESQPEAAVSARTGEGLQALSRRIDETLGRDRVVEADFEFSSSDSERLAMLYRRGKVLSRHSENDRILVRARVAESLKRQLQMSETEGA